MYSTCIRYSNSIITCPASLSLHILCCRKMVKIKKKVYVHWKSTIVHQGRTVTTRRRHNILQSTPEERGAHQPGATVRQPLQAVDVQTPEPEDGPVTVPVTSRVRKLQDVQAWIDIRASLHVPAVESLCPPPNPCCHVCQRSLDDTQIWRCCDCDISANLCCSCTKEIHSRFNVLHELELWDVSIFHPFPSVTNNTI